MKQRTIKKEISFEGIGLHTGTHCKVILKPASPDMGIVFIVEGEKIPAEIDFVSDTTRGTTLSKNRKTVRTVEHLLSALVGMQVDNVAVEVEGPEIPVLDGSSRIFAKEINRIGLVEQDKEVRKLRLNETLVRKFGDKKLIAHPDSKFSVSFAIDYNDKVVGKQFFSVDINPENYLKHIASAKTYVFEHDIKGLLEGGFSKGGSLENAIVITDNGVKNPEILTFDDEPVRHKILDLLGDLALLGKGRITFSIYAEKTGHKHHIEFVRELKNRIVSGDELSIDDILQYVPHRYPFLLLDKILSLEDDRVLAFKNVTFNEPFFTGHFPIEPVMPGVLIIEAIAQAGGFMLLSQIENRENKLVFFAGIDNARFRKPVKPGDQLIIETKLTKKRGSIVKFRGVARVNGQIVAEADLMASIVERSEK